jgi:hypothetical protein
MIEKIILAIAIAFALSWNIQIKPAQRSVAVEVESYLESLVEHQPPVLVML